jgi:hypothetical protein
MPLDPRKLRFRFYRWFICALGTRKTMPRRGKIVFALLIFSLSFAIKSLHAVDLARLMYTTEQPFGGIVSSHDRRAESILRGEGLLGPYDVTPSETMWLSRAHGYSILLAAIYRLFGRDFFTVQLIQNCLNSLGPVLIFLIAGCVVSWRVGIVSGVLAAISHHLSHISNFILPDSLCALPIMAAMYCLVLARRTRRAYLLYWLAGLLIGVSTWLRPQSLLLGAFAAGMLWLASRGLPMIKYGVPLTAISILMIAPITIRNYVVYREFVPISVTTGLALWEGIGDASGDRFGAVSRDEDVAAQEAILYGDPRYAGSWSSPDGIQRDRDRISKSLAIIRENPFWYAGVMLGRMGEMLSYSAQAPLVYGIKQAGSLERTAPIRKGWESLPSDSSSLAVGRSLVWIRPVIRLLQRITKEAMQLMIAFGALALFLASGRRALFISIVPLYYLVFQSFVHTEFRYTFPMQPFVFVFAAIGWILIGRSMLTGVKYLAGRVKFNASRL